MSRLGQRNALTIRKSTFHHQASTIGCMSAQDHLGPQWYHGSASNWHVGDVVDPKKSHSASHGESKPDTFYMTSSKQEANSYGHMASPMVRVPNSGKPNPNNVALGITPKYSPYIPPEQVARRYTVEPLGEVSHDEHPGATHRNAAQTQGKVRITGKHVITHAEHNAKNLYLPDRSQRSSVLPPTPGGYKP